MLTVAKMRNSNGVVLQGDFFDLDRLYFAIFKFTGFFGIDSKCTFDDCDEICEALLGLCYEIRHAWQGDRGLAQTYSGIKDYWFDDFAENISCVQESQLYSDDDEDDEYDDDADDEENDDDYYGSSFRRFSRKDYPDASANNTYFSIPLSFPDVLFYTLVLHDLLKKRDVFMEVRKSLAETEDTMQELNKQYYYFQADQDIARLIHFVNQTLHELYRFIGNDRYFKFFNKFDKIYDYTYRCDREYLFKAMEKYNKKDYEQDDPEILMKFMSAFHKVLG